MSSRLGSTRVVSGHQFVQLPSGTRLECNVSLAPTDNFNRNGQPNKLAICLHPWSWLGGTMDDPVLGLLERPLHSRGYGVIRYNSRGVGKSSGWSSLTGTREAHDLEELVQWSVASMSPVESLVLIGYSYGSLLVSLHPVLSEVRISHVLISYPLGPRHWLTAFHGKYYANSLNALLHDTRANVLVLYGDHDEFSSVENYDEWAETLSREARGKGELRTVKVANVTHFWRDHDSAQHLIESLNTWLP